MGQSAFDLYNQGLMRKKTGGPAPFIEQGVVADGTQRLSFSPTLVDSAHSIFAASAIIPANDRGTFLHYGSPPNGGIYRSSASLNATNVDPAASHVYDDATDTYTGNGNWQTGGQRIHMLCSTQPEGSGIRCNLASWAVDTGAWDVASSLLKDPATVIEFLTRGKGSVHLLSKHTGGNPFSGTLFRIAFWNGVSLNAHAAATQNLFFSGAGLVDPAASVASLGDTSRVVDAYGDAAVWDSGNFPKGSLTKTAGNAFVDAA